MTALRISAVLRYDEYVKSQAIGASLPVPDCVYIYIYTHKYLYKYTSTTHAVLEESPHDQEKESPVLGKKTYILISKSKSKWLAIQSADIPCQKNKKYQKFITAIGPRSATYRSEPSVGVLSS